MILAILDAVLGAGAGTSTANQLLGFELLFFLLCANAILFTSEVGFPTLEALIVSELEHGPLLQVVVVLIVRVFQAIIFI